MTEREVKTLDVLVDLTKQRVEVRVVCAYGDTTSVFMGPDGARDIAKKLRAAAAAIFTAAK